MLRRKRVSTSVRQMVDELVRHPLTDIGADLTRAADRRRVCLFDVPRLGDDARDNESCAVHHKPPGSRIFFGFRLAFISSHSRRLELLLMLRANSSRCASINSEIAINSSLSRSPRSLLARQPYSHSTSRPIAARG